jgi:hypothetical protein
VSSRDAPRCDECIELIAIRDGPRSDGLSSGLRGGCTLCSVHVPKQIERALARSDAYRIDMSVQPSARGPGPHLCYLIDRHRRADVAGHRYVLTE